MREERYCIRRRDMRPANLARARRSPSAGGGSAWRRYAIAVTRSRALAGEALGVALPTRRATPSRSARARLRRTTRSASRRRPRSSRSRRVRALRTSRSSWLRAVLPRRSSLRDLLLGALAGRRHVTQVGHERRRRGRAPRAWRRRTRARRARRRCGPAWRSSSPRATLAAAASRVSLRRSCGCGEPVDFDGDLAAVERRVARVAVACARLLLRAVAARLRAVLALGRRGLGVVVVVVVVVFSAILVISPFGCVLSHSIELRTKLLQCSRRTHVCKPRHYLVTPIAKVRVKTWKTRPTL